MRTVWLLASLLPAVAASRPDTDAEGQRNQTPVHAAKAPSSVLKNTTVKVGMASTPRGSRGTSGGCPKAFPLLRADCPEMEP